MKELSHEIKFIDFKSIVRNKEKNVDSLSAVAATSFPEEIKAKYIRDENYSIISTIVKVSSKSEYYRMIAYVKVIIYYSGDMVRSSPLTRSKINKRLEILSQMACANHIHEKIHSVS